jgi:hypothetical protein
MKTLLRTTLIALVLGGGFAALSLPSTQLSALPTIPTPRPQPLPLPPNSGIGR